MGVKQDPPSQFQYIKTTVRKFWAPQLARSKCIQEYDFCGLLTVYGHMTRITRTFCVQILQFHLRLPCEIPFHTPFCSKPHYEHSSKLPSWQNLTSDHCKLLGAFWIYGYVLQWLSYCVYGYVYWNLFRSGTHLKFCLFLSHVSAIFCLIAAVIKEFFKNVSEIAAICKYIYYTFMYYVLFASLFILFYFQIYYIKTAIKICGLWIMKS